VRRRLIALTALVLLWSTAVVAQQKGTVVSMAPAPVVNITATKSTPFELNFRIARKFHINSNKPNSELLIPTALKLSTPTDIMISSVSYPEGEQLAFDFAPSEKLSVYSGDFTITGKVRPLRSVRAGTYRVHGQLKYQACDDRACFPPANLPIFFDVKVGKPPATRTRRNPGQSPR
jgi:hypothetical protein